MSSLNMTLLFVLFLVEALLTWRFNRFYFTVGLPLFKTEHRSDLTSKAIPSAEQLIACMPNSSFQSLVFSQIDSTRFAFRESAWARFPRISYTPIMHGLLSFDGDTGRIRVVGLANWLPSVFLALVVVGIPMQDSFPFVAFLIGTLLLIYAIQFKRFREVATLAAACWSENKG